MTSRFPLREDRAIVEELATRLTDEGVRVFYDAYEKAALSHSPLASLGNRTVVNPFWPWTRLLEIIEPSINHVPVLRWQLQAAEWTARCRLKWSKSGRKQDATIQS